MAYSLLNMCGPLLAEAGCGLAFMKTSALLHRPANFGGYRIR